MNTHTKTLRIIVLAAIASTAAAIGIACSSDSSNGGNPAPTGGDSGNGGDGTTSSSSGSGSSSGGDETSSSSSGSGSGSSSGGMNDGGMMDVILIDTGGCMSDAANCNSCYTTAQAAVDPYNACSPYTVNCTPFANGTRITGLSADGGVPLVP